MFTYAQCQTYAPSPGEEPSNTDLPPLPPPLQSKSLAAATKEGIAEHVAEEKNDKTDKEPGSREHAPVQLPPVAASPAESTNTDPQNQTHQQNTSDDAVAMEVVTVTLAGPRRYSAICDNHASDEDEMDLKKGDVSAAKEIDFETIAYRFDDYFCHCCCRNWSVVLFQTKKAGSKAAR